MVGQISIEFLSRQDSLLALVLDAIFDGVYIADEERRVLFWNRGAEAITGYSREEVLGKRCRENILNHIDDSGCILCNSDCPLSKVIESGEPVTHKVYALHQSGRRIPCETHVAPLRDEDGRVVAAIEVFRDISHQEEFRILQKKFNKIIARYVSSHTLEQVMAQAKGEGPTNAHVKDLTILYLDLVGFTDFSERHRGEEAVALLNDVFGICDVLTTKYQGDVDKFIGDSVMAVFIDANDAVAAGKDILEAMRRFNEERREQGHEEVGVRIGINSGMVIQGDVGMRQRKDMTVIGDVVNTASRIEGLARRDSIFISEVTRARLANPDEFAYEGDLPVKNKKEPIRVYGYPPAAG